MKRSLFLLMVLGVTAPLCAGMSLGPKKQVQCVLLSSSLAGAASGVAANKYLHMHPGLCVAVAGAVAAIPVVCSKNIVEKAAASTSMIATIASAMSCSIAGLYLFWQPLKALIVSSNK